MRIAEVFIRDFFNTALATWLVLLSLELWQPGIIERQVNLEYYFYGLIFLYILYRLVKK